MKRARGTRLGQNFLMHKATASRIVEAAGITKNDTVLEVGPGKGMLTRELLARAKKVIALEVDTTLIPLLNETFAKEVAEKRLVLIEGDVRSFTPAQIRGKYSLVANIPYYITGEIIRHFLEATHKPSSMTLLVQKEVAERIARSKKESVLSLAVKAYGIPSYRFTVPKGAFVPSPSVDSAVLSITNINKNAFENAKEEVWFFSVIHAGFAHKRKLLLNNIATLVDKKTVEKAFVHLNLSLSVRAEDVASPLWRKLSKLIHTTKGFIHTH